jgi:hypothetical protein
MKIEYTYTEHSTLCGTNSNERWHSKNNQLTMMKATFLLSTLALSADAATKVAVLEFGKGGVVRRTTSKRTASSVVGVASFWGALHGRQLQQPDMPLVPDLFNKADRSMILGLTGVDLDVMPILTNLMNNEAVGHMEVEGKHCKSLMNKAGPAKESAVQDAVLDAKTTMSATGLNAMSLKVTKANSDAVEAQLQAILAELKAQATDGKTYVLHLVVEEEDEAAHRRLESRDLQNDNGKKLGIALETVLYILSFLFCPYFVCNNRILLTFCFPFF